MIIAFLFLSLSLKTFQTVAQSRNNIEELSSNFVHSLVNGNSDAALGLIDPNLHQDSASAMLDALRYRLMNNFGKEISVKTLGSEQVVLLLGSNKLLSQSPRRSYVQIEDGYKFSVIQVVFNDANKIVSFGMLREIYPKPKTQRMWMIGIPILLIVLGFNIFVMYKVYKSDVRRKWLKFLMILLLNLPSIGYSAINGVFFKIIYINLLGVSFSYSSYWSTYLVISFPIGAIIVYWKLKNNLYRTKADDWIYHVDPSN